MKLQHGSTGPEGNAQGNGAATVKDAGVAPQSYLSVAAVKANPAAKAAQIGQREHPLPPVDARMHARDARIMDKAIGLGRTPHMYGDLVRVEHALLVCPRQLHRAQHIVERGEHARQQCVLRQRLLGLVVAPICLVDHLRLGLAPDVKHPQPPKMHTRHDTSVHGRGVCDPNLAGTRPLAQTRGDVDSVAIGVTFEFHHFTGGDANPYRHAHRLRPARQRELVVALQIGGSLDCGVRVGEDAQHAIAQLFHHAAAMGHDDIAHPASQAHHGL